MLLQTCTTLKITWSLLYVICYLKYRQNVRSFCEPMTKCSWGTKLLQYVRLFTYPFILCPNPTCASFVLLLCVFFIASSIGDTEDSLWISVVIHLRLEELSVTWSIINKLQLTARSSAGAAALCSGVAVVINANVGGSPAGAAPGLMRLIRSQ